MATEHSKGLRLALLMCNRSRGDMLPETRTVNFAIIHLTKYF